MSVEGYGRIFLPEFLEDDVLRLLAPDIVDDAALGVVDGQNRLYEECREIERQASLTAGEIVTPRAWNTITADDDWPIDRLPAILIMLGGSPEAPLRDEDGIHHDLRRLEIAAVCSAHTYREAKKDAERIGMAIRAVIAQQLSGFSENCAGLKIDTDAPRRIPLRDPERVDTVAAYQVAFAIAVPDAVSDTISVTDPPDDPDEPSPDDPIVDEGAVEFDLTIT